MKKFYHITKNINTYFSQTWAWLVCQANTAGGKNNDEL